MSIFKLKQLIAIGLDSAVDIDNFIKLRKDRYVLSYHRVLLAQKADRDGVHPSLWISPHTFESQIKWMQKVGKIVDYKKIVDIVEPHSRPLFALTFDDGWKDNYKYAFPILKHYKVPAHIFLATEAVDTGELFWPQDIATKTKMLLSKGSFELISNTLHELHPKITRKINLTPFNIMANIEQWIEVLKSMNTNERQQQIIDYFNRLNLSTTPLTGQVLSWSDAREMKSNGVSFGSHTHSHIILDGQTSDIVEYELNYSKELISDRLQCDVDSFCYPNGRYSGNESALLIKCGYRYGFRLDNTSLRHCSNNYYIPRFLVNERKSSNSSFFKLSLLESPLYRSKAYKKLNTL